jgi:hypothetical protein
LILLEKILQPPHGLTRPARRDPLDRDNFLPILARQLIVRQPPLLPDFAAQPEIFLTYC